MAAQHHGSIHCSLGKLGTPIGVNDLHIAAQARSQVLVVVTNNVSEFARVPGLMVKTSKDLTFKDWSINWSNSMLGEML